jgi:hypothetical protein
MNHSDRRTATRFNATIPFRYREWNSNAEEELAESINISKSGLYFESDSVHLLGTELRLKLEMPEDITGLPSEVWSCIGHIVRLQAGMYNADRLGVAVCIDFFESLKDMTEKETGKKTKPTPETLDISDIGFREVAEEAERAWLDSKLPAC